MYNKLPRLFQHIPTKFILYYFQSPPRLFATEGYISSFSKYFAHLDYCFSEIGLKYSYLIKENIGRKIKN